MFLVLRVTFDVVSFSAWPWFFVFRTRKGAPKLCGCYAVKWQVISFIALVEALDVASLFGTEMSV